MLPLTAPSPDPGIVVSIVAECPHCENRFTLQPDLAGKAMRCPNPDCREVFVVREAEPPPPPTAATVIEGLKPKPKPTSGQIGDFVPVLDVAPAAPPPPPKKAPPPEPKPEPRSEKKSEPKPERPATPTIQRPTLPPKPAPPEPIVGEVVEPVVVEAALVASPPVREVTWSPDMDAPVPASTQRDREPDDEPLFLPRRRKKRSRWPVYLLIGMVGSVVIAGIWGGLVWLQRTTRAETQLARQAEEQYKSGDYAAAAKTYEQLAREHSGSDEHPRYEFLAALSALQRDVRSVAVKEEPGPAIAKVLAFIEAHKNSPLVKPEEGGLGGEVLGAGRKVSEDAADHAEGRIKAFRADRSKSGELERARQTIVAGRELVQKLDPLRSPSDPPFDGLRIRFDGVEKDIAFERNRLDVLARLRPRLERPTDRSVEEAKEELVANGLSGDPEASKLVQDASAMLGRQVRYVAAPAAPQRIPPEYAASIAFLASIGPTIPPDRSAPDGQKPGTFLAVGRGLVYAFDEDTGAPLWAVRVGPAITEPPAVATVETAEGPTGLAVVVSHVAGNGAVAGHDLRTGAVRWYQPLPAAPVGSAVVVGTRAFVALRDPEGTLVEFDLTSGNRVGAVSLGQPIGPPPVLRPGTGLIYVTAEARRVYVLDVGARDIDGNRLPPRCAQVLATGHLPGTVRTAPVVLGPEGDAAAERWLVFSQVAGPAEMRLRAYPLPAFQPPSSDGLPPPGVAVAPAISANLPGWAWFAPITDGERLAVVTDTGELRLFGVNQPGNRDPVLFPLPHPPFAALPDGGGVPGLVIPAEEGAFWVLAGGDEVRKVRIALDPTKGQIAEVMPRSATPGKPTLAGIPTQPVMVNARRDTAFLVVRSASSPACRAVAFDLTSGEVRWQRQLGVVAVAAPIGTGGGLVLAGDDGSAAVITATTPQPEPGGTRLSDLVVAAPLDGLAGRTVAAASDDGSVVYTLTPVRYQGKPALAVRKLAGGRVEREGRIPIESPPAGPPIIFGNTVMFPAANGFVYRVAWTEPAAKDENGFDQATLVPGPRWRPLDRANPNAVCFLTPLGDDRLAITDGERTVAVWLWAVGGEQPTGTTWTLPQPVAAAPLFLPGRDMTPARVLVADVTGGVWLFAADRGGAPLRRWRPDGTEVAAGKPTSGLALQVGSGGELSVAYVVEGRHVLFLDPDRENWRWAVRGEDGAERTVVGMPQPAGAGRWLVTDLGGRVTLFDPAKRQRTVIGEVGMAGVVPVSAGVLAEPSRVVIPLSDGSAAVIGFEGPNAVPPNVAPPPRPIEQFVRRVPLRERGDRMKTLADRFRRWYEYERDCNAKAMEMLASVPADRRSAPEFQKAVDRLAHLVAARQRWLQRLGHWPDAPKLFPTSTKLEELPALVSNTEAAWVAYLERLDDEELARVLEWQAPDGRRYRWGVEGVLTQLFGHAWYHRGQISQLVAALGGKAVDTDYVFWCKLTPLDPVTS